MLCVANPYDMRGKLAGLFLASVTVLFENRNTGRATWRKMTLCSKHNIRACVITLHKNKSSCIITQMKMSSLMEKRHHYISREKGSNSEVGTCHRMGWQCGEEQHEGMPERGKENVSLLN